MNDKLLVPQHISKYGLYTSQFILFDCLYCLYDDYAFLSFLLFLLYITSMIHWRELHRYSLIRYADISATLTVLIRTTLVDSIRWKQYRQVWFNVLYISFIAYSMNKYAIYKNGKHRKLQDIDYYISVFVHTLFLHVIIPSTAFYCAISVKMDDNYIFFTKKNRLNFLTPSNV